MTLEEAIAKIKPLDHNAMEIAQKRWDSIAKPLHSLGKLETLLIQIAGITGNAEVDLSRRGLIAMCADNGVVEEGVTQTGQEVTAIVAENFEMALDEIIWLITLLANQSVLIHNLQHPEDKKEPLTQDAVELLTSPFELAGYKEAIMEAMYKGTKRNIESETDSKNVEVG